MERYGFCAAAGFMILGGLWMIAQPIEAALMHRERDEGSHPPTAGEIWNVRVVGGGMIVIGIFILYAFLTNTPGSDILTP